MRSARRENTSRGAGRPDGQREPATEEVTVDADGSVGADVLAAAVRKAGYDVATAETVLQVGGMTSCASCAGRLERALLKVPGVSSASVNFSHRSGRRSRRCRPCLSPYSRLP